MGLEEIRGFYPGSLDSPQRNQTNIMTPSHLICFLVIGLGGAGSARGVTLTSIRFNFTIDTPASWSQVAAPTNVLFAVRSADAQKALLVVALESPEVDADQMLAGARQGTKDQGMEVIETP